MSFCEKKKKGGGNEKQREKATNLQRSLAVNLYIIASLGFLLIPVTQDSIEGKGR